MIAPNEAISTSKSADIACLFAALSLMLRLAAIYHLEYFISYSSLSSPSPCKQCSQGRQPLAALQLRDCSMRLCVSTWFHVSFKTAEGDGNETTGVWGVAQQGTGNTCGEDLSQACKIGETLETPICRTGGFLLQITAL